MIDILDLLLFGGIMNYNAYQESDINLFGISIVSAGHTFAYKNRQVNRPNGRKDYLLYYVAKGTNHVFLDKETIVEEGSFIIFKPFEKQCHIQKDKAMSEFYFIHFNAPETFDLFNFESSTAYKIQPSSKVRDLFEEVIEELRLKPPFYEKMCSIKLLNILALLERKIEKESKPKGFYADKISFVLQKMNKEYDKNFSLEEFAEMCNISRFHFLRIFKSLVGCTPIEYRNEIRLDHAKELLMDTDLSIEEISEKVGYSTSSYFCDAFKKKYKKSPSRYRKEQEE